MVTVSARQGGEEMKRGTTNYSLIWSSMFQVKLLLTKSERTQSTAVTMCVHLAKSICINHQSLFIGYSSRQRKRRKAEKITYSLMLLLLLWLFNSAHRYKASSRSMSHLFFAVTVTRLCQSRDAGNILQSILRKHFTTFSLTQYHTRHPARVSSSRSLSLTLSIQWNKASCVDCEFDFTVHGKHAKDKRCTHTHTQCIQLVFECHWWYMLM